MLCCLSHSDALLCYTVTRWLEGRWHANQNMRPVCWNDFPSFRAGLHIALCSVGWGLWGFPQCVISSLESVVWPHHVLTSLPGSGPLGCSLFTAAFMAWWLCHCQLTSTTVKSIIPFAFLLPFPFNSWKKSATFIPLNIIPRLWIAFGRGLYCAAKGGQPFHPIREKCSRSFNASTLIAKSQRCVG